jgi:hypothetical protein
LCQFTSPGRWNIDSSLKTNLFMIVGSEVLTATVVKSSIFWDTIQCSPLRDIRRFGGMSSQSSALNSKPSKKLAWSRQPEELVIYSSNLKM